MNDFERGVFILVIFVLFVGGGLMFYVVWVSVLEVKGVFLVVSCESVLVLNNILLVVLVFVVFIGMFWLLIVEMIMDCVLLVGLLFFNVVFMLFVIGFVVVLLFGFVFVWKCGNFGWVGCMMGLLVVFVIVVVVLFFII